MSGRQTMNDRLEAFLKARPNRWIDGRELATVAGSYAWRTRCSELRLKVRQCGLDIDNRQYYVPTSTGKVKVSEYKLVVPEGQLALL